MFDENGGSHDNGMQLLEVLVMIIMFVGTCFFFFFKAGGKVCDVTGKVTKWGVARFKNRNF